MCIKCDKIITLRVKNDNHCKNDKKNLIVYNYIRICFYLFFIWKKLQNIL